MRPPPIPEVIIWTLSHSVFLVRLHITANQPTSAYQGLTQAETRDVLRDAEMAEELQQSMERVAASSATVNLTMVEPPGDRSEAPSLLTVEIRGSVDEEEAHAAARNLMDETGSSFRPIASGDMVSSKHKPIYMITFCTNVRINVGVFLF